MGIRKDNPDQGWITKRGAPRWSVSTAQDDQYFMDVVSDFQHSFNPSRGTDERVVSYGSSEVINAYLSAVFAAHAMGHSLFFHPLYYIRGLRQAFGYKGSYKKAEAFTAVWTSLFFMDIFGVDSPDDPSIDGITRTLSERMAGVDRKKTYNHIRDYLIQKQSSSIQSWLYLHLWCLETLGRSVNFRKIPIPMIDITALVERRILKSEDLLTPDQMTHMAQTYKSLFESAAESFTNKEEARLKMGSRQDGEANG